MPNSVMSPDSSLYEYDAWKQGGGDLEDRLLAAGIPVNDGEAWLRHGELRWMFNKLVMAQLQGIECAPHGIPPTHFPAFSKPIYNLEGLSAGAVKLDDWKTEYYTPGHFWMQYLPEPQLSWDIVFWKGTPLFVYAMQPEFDSVGSIVCWRHAFKHEHLDTLYYICRFMDREVPNYTGCLSAETRGGKIIEAMPRMSPQFVDFYAHGDAWFDLVFSVYAGKDFKVPASLPGGISKVKRVPASQGHRVPYVKDAYVLYELDDTFEKDWVTRIYLPFYGGQRLDTLSDDPYSYRLIIVNGFDEELIDKTIDLVFNRVIGWKE